MLKRTFVYKALVILSGIIMTAAERVREGKPVFGLVFS